MEIKKYYAYDMQEALQQIKDELGPDAVILSSRMERKRKGPLGVFSRRVIEVVVGYEEKERHVARRPIAAKPRPQPAAKAPQKPEKETLSPQTRGRAAQAYQSQSALATPPVAPVADYGSQLGELKRMIETVSNKVEGIGRESEAHFSEETAAFYRRLLDQDVAKDVAKELCERAQDISARKGAPIGEVLASLLEEEIGAPALITPTRFQRKVVMVIGPTGVGKTTTLVKLASKMIVEQGLKVGIINSDVYRVGAQEQLKTYCEILGTEMATIYKPEELPAALDAMQNADVVFLDTAGKVSQDKNYQAEVGKLMELGNVDDILLTISASSAARAMQTALKNYAFLNRHSLLITKVDEMGTLGALLNARRFSGRPLSYITLGQAVPEDIAEIDPQEIAAQLIG